MTTHRAVHVDAADGPFRLDDVETTSPPADHVGIAVQACAQVQERPLEEASDAYAGTVAGSDRYRSSSPLREPIQNPVQRHLQPDILSNWICWFGSSFDQTAALPAKLESEVLDIEGRALNWLAVGDADGTLATVVHGAELDTVCAGDAVYNNIHMWLWNSTPESRAAWPSTIDAIATMKPRTIIAGHRDPDAPDDDAGRAKAISPIRRGLRPRGGIVDVGLGAHRRDDEHLLRPRQIHTLCSRPLTPNSADPSPRQRDEGGH